MASSGSGIAGDCGRLFAVGRSGPLATPLGGTGAGDRPSWRGTGGFVKASAALAADGDSWQITRAGGEVEKLTATLDDRQISEPRAVVTAAGRWSPATGQIDISSAELLTPTLSLRTGGLALLPDRRSATLADGMDTNAIMDRLRGKLQWQADVARLERWLALPAVVERWPASGRAWGTVEVLDTPIGLNLLVEATGASLLSSARSPLSPLALARRLKRRLTRRQARRQATVLQRRSRSGASRGPHSCWR